MQATEQPPTGVTETGARSPHLEEWSETDRMRHIPSLSWIVAKLDSDVRRRFEILWLPFSDLAASDPRHQAIEAEFRGLCRALQRVAEIARRGRGAFHPPNELAPRIRWLIGFAVTHFNETEHSTFGHRYPFHLFERSYAEPLWAAVLQAIERLHRLTDLVRPIEPDLDERLYEGLVQLREPLRREPIA